MCTTVAMETLMFLILWIHKRFNTFWECMKQLNSFQANIYEYPESGKILSTHFSVLTNSSQFLLRKFLWSFKYRIQQFHYYQHHFVWYSRYKPILKVLFIFFWRNGRFYLCFLGIFLSNRNIISVYCT